MKIDRPLDYLDNYKDKEVCVYLKDSLMTGVLLAFDIHINLVIEVGKTSYFIRGDNVIKVEGIAK